MQAATLPPGAASDTVEEAFSLAGRAVRVLRPRDVEAIVDELIARGAQDDDLLPLWAQLWPSGVALAPVVASRPLSGARVLELGCGLGLTSIAAALAGADVLAVDRSPDAISFTLTNAARNGATLRTEVCALEEPGAVLAEAPWELVLAADLLYESRNLPLLLHLLPRLVDTRGEVWLADPGRPLLERFLSEMDAGGWHRERVDAGSDDVTIHRLRGPSGPVGIA